jgi:uncharacterized protein (TIGR00251 family)
MRLQVRVTTRAARDEIAGEREGAVLVRVTAPPADGKANAAVCKTVARAVGVAPTRVRVVRGESARTKTLEIDDVDESQARRLLGLA